MKKIIVTMIVCCGIIYADSSYNLTVTTNSTMVLPYADASGISISSWVSGTTYDQGDYARVSSARYWTPNGGTSTNQPSHIEGTVTNADNVVWVRITNADRRVAVISNTGTNTLWLTFGNTTASSSNGIPLYSWERYTYEGQKEAMATTSSGTAYVTCVDEDE